MHATLTETARAKVNLTLRVLGRRPDGYHDLESLVVFADIGDRITFVPGAEPAVRVTGPFAGAIDGENIALRALRALADRGLTLGSIEIEKRLPVAAGIGGGSADAAAVLRAIRRANPDRDSAVDWPALAASLGADVPVCLASAAQLMWGVGGETAPLPSFPPLPAVLINPGVPLATADVFRALSAPPLSSPSRAPSVPGPFGDAAAAIACVRGAVNDLEPVARRLCPGIDDVLAALRAEPGVKLARMSGSGPTCFAVFRTTAAAEEAARRLRARASRWWVEAAMLG